MADHVKELFDGFGVGGFFTPFALFLILVLLVLGCGGCV